MGIAPAGVMLWIRVTKPFKPRSHPSPFLIMIDSPLPLLPFRMQPRAVHSHAQDEAANRRSDHVDKLHHFVMLLRVSQSRL